MANSVLSSQVDNDRLNARVLCAELQSTKDAKNLLPKIIKLMANNDVGVKRICYSSYVRHHQKVPGEAVLAVNTILMDSRHPSPQVRALVLNTVPYIRNEAFQGICQRIVTDGLNDTNVVVRRHAVIAHHISHTASESPNMEKNIIDLDPIITGYNLQIIASAGHKLEEKTIPLILSYISTLTSDGLLEVLKAVKSYQPKDQTQLLEILNIIDLYLDSDKVEIVTATLEVFLSYAKNVSEEELRRDMFIRLTTSCLVPLRSSDSLTVYSMMLWLQSNLQDLVLCSTAMAILQENCYLFFVKATEVPYMVALRLHVLKALVTAENVELVLDTVKSVIQSSTLCSETCQYLLNFLSHINESFAEKVSGIFSELLSMNSETIRIGLLQHLHNFREYADPVFQIYTSQVLHLWRKLEEQDLLVLLSLLSNFAFVNEDNLPAMNALSAHVISPSCTSVAVKCAWISALVKCFRSQPAEYFPLLKTSLTALSQEKSSLLDKVIKLCVVEIQSFTNP